MGVSISVDPRLSALLGALGLLDADGSIEPSWFADPIGSIRHCLDNDTQRAALLRLLDQALPAADSPPGGSWHPILEPNDYGNVYVTVEDTTVGGAAGAQIGIAGQVGTTWTDLPTVRATVKLPLVSAANGATLVTVGPVEFGVFVDLVPIGAIGVRVLVGIDGTVGVVIRLEDPSTSPPTVAEFDPTRLDVRAVQALQALIESVIRHEVSQDPRVLRVVGHLPGVLGLGDTRLSPFPVTEPAQIRAWFAGILASPAALRAWFTHVAGLLGALPLDQDDPRVSGQGVPVDPLRATLLSVDGVALQLHLASGGPPGEPALHLGIGVEAAWGPPLLPVPLSVGAYATLVAIPISGTAPARALPQAAALVAAGINGGFVDGGVVWDGVRVAPLLRLRNVVIAGEPRSADLTDANAIAATAIDAALDAALGDLYSALGDRVLALVGIAAPTGDPQSPHHIQLVDALTGNFLRAVAEVHRSILDCEHVTRHSWGHVLGDLAGLIGLDGDVDGTGTRGDPWRVGIAAERNGDVTLGLELVAWDDRRAETPVGAHLLRLGLRAVAGGDAWQAAWSTELLAFDLTPAAPTVVRLIGAQHLDLTFPKLPTVDDVAGVSASVTRVKASLTWLPGTAVQVSATFEGIRVSSGDDVAGPVTVVLPGTPDPRLPDLGLGIDPAQLVALVRLLLARAWSLWGSDGTAHAVAGLLGLHDRLGGLPSDWPSPLRPATADLSLLFANPTYALAEYGRAILTGVSGDDDNPFALTALDWLAALVQGRVPVDPDARPSQWHRPGGAGTHDRPWRIPLADGAAVRDSSELLVWLDGGPTLVGAPDLAGVTSGEALLATLAAAAEIRDDLDEVEALLHGRDPGLTGLAVDDLADWLATGDGLTPYASQTAVPSPLWTVGTPLAVPYDQASADASAIAQTRAALASWGAPVLVLASATSGSWAAMLAAIEPGRDPDAEFDLRGQPSANLLTVTASTTAYLLWLDDGDLVHRVDQVDRVAGRVRGLTGASKVALVGHGPDGVLARVVAARLAAEARAAGTQSPIAGVITIAAPHGGSDLSPLTRPDLSDAVRVASGLSTNPALTLLRSILDGGPPRDGLLPPAGTYSAATFAGVPAATPPDAGPGLAIGSRLPPGLVAATAAVWAARLRPIHRTASHLGIGARVNLAGPSTQEGIQIRTSLRVDLVRIRLQEGPEPARSPRQVTVTSTVTRPGGWLVGDAGDRVGTTGRAQTRVRWMRLGLTLDQDSAGAMTATPIVALYEAGLPGTSTAVVDLPAILDALSTRPPTVSFPAGPQGPAADLLRAGLRAVDLTDAAGDLVVANLRALNAAPLAWLGPRLAALLGVLAPANGATASGGGWSLGLLGGIQQLSLTPAPWTLHLVTGSVAGSDASAAGPVSGILGGLTVDGSLTIPTMLGSASASLDIGVLRLRWRDGALELSLPPWLEPIRLHPDPDPQAGAKVAAALPRALLSAGLGLLLQPFLGDTRSLPLDLLFAAPGEFVRRAISQDGMLRAARVNTLLATVSTLLGREPAGTNTPAGLALPGGLRLHAVESAGSAGVDPATFALRLGGVLEVDAASLAFDIGLGLAPDLTPSPSGTIALTVELPGAWGGLTIDLGLQGPVVHLAVTPTQPANATAIQILPTFSGVGAVVTGAVALLPHLLQSLVDERTPPVAQTRGPVLTGVLDLAEALAIYAPDDGGFENPAASAQLASMLQPSWWTALVNDAPALAGYIAALFRANGPLPLPVGSITHAAGGRTVDWTLNISTLIDPNAPAPHAIVTVRLGWSAAGDPVVTITATALALGPVVLDSLTLGFDGQVRAAVQAHLAMAGVLAPFTAAVEIGLAGDRFSSRILPLGAGRDEFELRLAPSLSLSASTEAALELALRWGLPTVLNIVIAALGDSGGGTSPLERPFWTYEVNGATIAGPTARSILAGAGLVPATGPLLVNGTLPEPLAIILGAIRAALNGFSVELTPSLSLSLVREATPPYRSGIRLSGYQGVETDDLTVRIVLGRASWFDDADGGVTVWLIADDASAFGARLAPGLSLVGVGVVLDGRPRLVNGSVVLGAAGGVLFFEASFLDASGAPRLQLEDIGAALAVERSFVNLSGSDGDSFLAKVLPAELKAPFDLAVIYRHGTLRFGGTSPLSTGHIEFVIPLNLDFTVIKITELLLGLRIASGQFSIEAALSGGLDVGPIVATIKRVGLVASFGQGGVGLRFRPPDMVGLAIDASTIRLGGFLLVDAERGRYIGAIEIAVLKKFELTAIGIITTKMPDGSPGFSLLFIISMTLPVGIPLGYGFFFSGAGGLLGLNRGSDFDALRNGLRTGAAESILFPRDVVRRADAIVRDLEAVFPIAQGQFVVGPMVLITWMNPAIVSVKLGIILELGTPIRIGILGILQLALPDPSAAVLNLKAAFLGTVDFAAGLLSFDASIYDSGIGIGDFKLSLEGDIALRLSWGAKPDFVTSVGGFHPSFHPDAHLKLPQMRRLAVSLLRDNPHLTLATYFAVTANSVQIGAALDFGFEVAGFSITGAFGFDVLLQFSPFLFDAVIYARLLVKAGSLVILQLSMDFSLRGPTPWTARGTATFTILFLSIKVWFEKTFGQALEPSIPDVAVLPPLLAELRRAENWSAVVAPGTVTVVALLPIEPAEGSVVIEPSGVVAVTQRMAPLSTTMTRFGANRPNDVSRVDAVALRIGGVAVPTQPLTELFSPGAFQVLPDDDKLRSEAYVQRPAGLRVVDPSPLVTDYVVRRASRYDLIESDSQTEHRTVARSVPVAVFQAQVAGGVLGHSPAARLLAEEAEHGSVLAVGPAADRYGVAREEDLRPVDATGVVAHIDTGPQGQPVLPAGIVLLLPDAQARARALRRTTGVDYQVVPESQLVVVPS